MVSHEKGSDLYARYATDCNPQSYVACSTQGNAGRMEGSHLLGRHLHTIIIVVSLSRIAEETQDMVVQGQRISTSTTV
jgi:hypothetical protein